MFDNPQKTQAPPALHESLNPFTIAAGLLRNDVLVLLPAFFVLALSAFIRGLSSLSDAEYIGAFMVFERFLQLAVVSFIVIRWRRRFEHGKGRRLGSSQALLRIVLSGFVVWAALTIPVLGASFTSWPWLSSLCLIMFFVSVFWFFRFYFYFATFGLLSGSAREVSRVTLEISRRDPKAALRSLVAPLAVTALVWGLVSLPSPDGRSLFWATVGSTTVGFFCILATYTGLAFALILIDDRTWREAGLDPYRRERLLTLEAQGRFSHFNWLAPRDGAKIFLVAACAIVFSMYQGLHSAPAPKVSLQSCEARNHGISVVLELSDPHYKFRGFNPYAFSLRSQTGFDEISGLGGKVSMEPGGAELPVPLPESSDPITVRVDFKSNKTQEALIDLDNMYLWYNLKALVPVKACVVATPPVLPAPENPQK